jgi:hypothetical protein
MPNGFIHSALRPPVYFYHIPKTGGMSLRSFLADQYLDEDLCPAQDWQSLAALDRASLQSFRLFYGHFAVNLKQYLPSEVRTITYLRSPVGRTVSTIRHMMRDPSFHPLHAHVKGRALRDVIYDDDLLLTFQDAQTKLLSFDVPIEDVLAYVRRQVAAQKFVDIGELEWESSPDKALRALETYDFVGLMDHFKESIWAMCGKFGFAPPDILPELNKATDEQSPPDLTEKDVAHLRSFLAADIEIYDKIRQNALERLNREEIFADMSQKGILTTLSTPFELDLGRPFLGSGWYEPEQQGDRSARWSGPESKALLHFPLRRDTKRSLYVEFIKAKGIGNVEMLVDGEKVDALTECYDNVWSMEAELPPLSSENQPLVTTITLDCRRPSRPKERNDGDLRALGLLLLTARID